MNVESRAGTRDFPRQRPNVQSRAPERLLAFQIDRDARVDLASSRLPEHDRADAPGAGSQQPCLTRAQGADHGAEQDLRINVRASPTLFRWREGSPLIRSLPLSEPIRLAESAPKGNQLCHRLAQCLVTTIPSGPTLSSSARHCSWNFDADTCFMPTLYDRPLRMFNSSVGTA